MNIPPSKKFVLGVIAVLGLLPLVSNAASPIDSALVWWAFENDTTGTNSRDLTAVSSATSGLTPVISMSYSTVAGVSAINTGAKAVEFDGAGVLKTNSASLRLGGAQTFWLRVNFASVTGSYGLMNRSRSTSGQRGISLQMSNGRLQAFASEDAQAYQGQVVNSSSYALSAGTWYDIALRFTPSVSLRIDLYNPTTGALIETIQSTTNIPASIVATNSPGAGYFQVGGLNNGSSGSSLVFADGTLVEAAGVWNTALSDADIASLSAVASTVPEPATMAWLTGALVLMAVVFSRRRVAV